MDPTTVSAFRRTRIFAIGTPEECRALSWGFRQFGSASVAPEITECPLGNIRAAKNEADFLVVFIDLGQPLPAAALNEVARDIPGTFVFTQPTPTQLLSVFQFPLWAAQVWDGSNGQNLAREITSHMVGAEKLVRQKIFFRDAQTILNEASRVPTNLEWMNPPRSLTSTKVALDSGRGIFTIGAQDSKSDLELPVSAKGPLLELRFVSGAWIPQVLNQGIKVQGIQSGKPVRSGDSIEIGGFVMVARAPDAINRLSALVKQEVNGFESPEETDQ